MQQRRHCPQSIDVFWFKQSKRCSDAGLAPHNGRDSLPPVDCEYCSMGTAQSNLVQIRHEPEWQHRVGARQTCADYRCKWSASTAAAAMSSLHSVSRFKQYFLMSSNAGWAPSDGRGVLSLVEREYGSNGTLTEVRSRTAVRGGWVGGRM